MSANEFNFIKDSAGKVVETVSNDKDETLSSQLSIQEKNKQARSQLHCRKVAGTDATVTYDTMKANVTKVTVHRWNS